VYFQGTDQELEIYKIYGRHDGPTIMILGGIQGDEPGAFMSADLYVDTALERGNLIVVPRANFKSIIAFDRGLVGDMNRKFSEAAAGPTPASDPDMEAVRVIKNLMAESDLFLNLHDGSGFYRHVWESEMANPKRYGQCIIADAEEYRDPRSGREIALGRDARRAVEIVNRDIPEDEFKFRFSNHDTLSETTRHAEQRASATYYALTVLGIPAFGIETSKQLPNLEMKIRQHNLAVNAFMEIFGVVPESPRVRLDPPELSFMVISVEGHPNMAVRDGETLLVPAGAAVSVLLVASNYTRGLSADVLGLGGLNDMETPLRIDVPTSVVARRDNTRIGLVELALLPDGESVPRTRSARPAVPPAALAAAGCGLMPGQEPPRVILTADASGTAPAVPPAGTGPDGKAPAAGSAPGGTAPAGGQAAATPQGSAPSASGTKAGSGTQTASGPQAGAGSPTASGIQAGSGTQTASGSQTPSGTQAGAGSPTASGTQAGSGAQAASGSQTASGTQAGTGSPTASGTQAGSGSQPASGTQPGSGPQAASGTQAVSGSPTASGTQPGSGPQAASGTQAGSGPQAASGPQAGSSGSGRPQVSGPLSPPPDGGGEAGGTVTAFILEVDGRPVSLAPDETLSVRSGTRIRMVDISSTGELPEGTVMNFKGFVGRAGDTTGNDMGTECDTARELIPYHAVRRDGDFPVFQLGAENGKEILARAFVQVTSVRLESAVFVRAGTVKTLKLGQRWHVPAGTRVTLREVRLAGGAALEEPRITLGGRPVSAKLPTVLVMPEIAVSLAVFSKGELAGKVVLYP
jgi:hypothetical protein